jgi:hypothetical protein
MIVKKHILMYLQYHFQRFFKKIQIQKITFNMFNF